MIAFSLEQPLSLHELSLLMLVTPYLSKLGQQWQSPSREPQETPIFISHHVVCSLISFCCCNHLSSMLMTIKLIVIHLELNNIGHKLVFHSYAKSTSNMWYTLICKFEKCKPNPKKNYMGMNKYHLLDFFENLEKIENRKLNFAFWNFKD